MLLTNVIQIKRMNHKILGMIIILKHRERVREREEGEQKKEIKKKNKN